MIKTCAICGKEFETANNRQIYCGPECSWEGRRAVGRSYYQRKKEGKEPEATKTCPICGKTFEVDRYRISRRYCSDECSLIGKRAQEKAYRERNKQAKKPPEPKTCPVCGTTFTPASNKGRKYCSPECYRKANRETKGGRQPYATGETKKKYRNEHTRLAVEGRARGLTYGQYVAMVEMGARYELHEKN